MNPEDSLEPTPDGGMVVTLDDPVSESPVDFGDDDDENLVFVLMKTEEGKKALRVISGDVLRKFDADWSASEGYRKRIADDHQVLYCEMSRKAPPFQDAANANVPSTLENMTRIVARMEGEICGDWTNIFGVLPVGGGDEELAQMLTLHGNWQIREKLKDFPRQISRGIWMFMMDGDVTCHSYWDSFRNVPMAEMLTPDEFVTPYTFNTTQPDYSDLPHYTKIFRKYRHELEAMEGVWYDVQAVIENRTPSFDDEPDETMREARAKIEEIEPPTDGSDAPYKLLHHEGWMNLPGRDKQRWCQVILDPVSRNILKLTIHEEINWQDKLRFERETAELQTWQSSEQMRQMALGQAQQAQAMHDEALPHMAPVQADIAAQKLQAIHAQVPPQMPPPPWMKDGMTGPAPIKRDPIYMFSHGVCIESLVGNLGLSFGRIQADLNRAQNVMLCQFIDAASLANGGTLLTTDAIEEDSPIEWGPGKIIKVPGIPQGQLQANMQMMQFPPANQQLLEGVKIFGEMAQSSLQAPSVLSGEPGKSGETYRGISSRIEQATKQLSVPARAFCRFLKQILMNLAKLNAVYLDDDEVAAVVHNGMPTVVQATKEMYARNYQITINADLRFASQTQRIAEADELVAMPKAVPALQANLVFQWEAAKKALEARGRQDMIPFLGERPAIQPFFTLPGLPPQMGGIPIAAPPGGPGAPSEGGGQPTDVPNQGGDETPPPGSGPPPSPKAPSPPRAPSPPQPAGPPG